MSTDEQQAKPLLGFVGLGKMGQAMARNLVKAGFTVKLYNRSQPVVQSLVQECQVYPGEAIAARHPCELADVHILFSMVAHDAALQSVLVESGLLAAMGANTAGAHAAHHEETSQRANAMASDASPVPPPRRPPCTCFPFRNAMHVSCATLSVHFAQQMHALHTAHHVEYVAMPVLGRPDAAVAATLHLLFGGSEAVRAYLQPLLLVPVLGQSLRYYGAEPEKANVVKVAFNFTLACSIGAMAQGCALVQKHGIAPADYTTLLSETLFDCTAYRGYGGMISRRAFQPAGATLRGVGLKDCTLALDAGERAEVPLPFASVLRDQYLQGIACGMGDWDWSAIALVAEHNAGIVHNDGKEKEREAPK